MKISKLRLLIFTSVSFLHEFFKLCPAFLDYMYNTFYSPRHVPLNLTSRPAFIMAQVGMYVNFHMEI